MEHASDLLGLYGVETPSRHSIEQCRILDSSVDADEIGSDRRCAAARAEQALVEVKRNEDEAAAWSSGRHRRSSSIRRSTRC